VGKGLEIIEGLRGHTSGYAVPTYVIDAPGGGGKIPVMPNYLISYSDHKVVLRNYEGYITTYEEPETYRRHDASSCRFCRSQRAEPGQGGVHGLLQGDRMWIEPRGFEEVHARGNTDAHRLQDPSKWVPYGVGAIEGSAIAGRPLPMLEDGGVPDPMPPGGAPAPVYGPGEEPRPREGEPTAAAHGELL
jgi:lysine 2,3-aminomutase